MARHFATRSTRPDDEFYYKSTQWGWVSSIQQRFFISVTAALDLSAQSYQMVQIYR